MGPTGFSICQNTENFAWGKKWDIKYLDPFLAEFFSMLIGYDWAISFVVGCANLFALVPRSHVHQISGCFREVVSLINHICINHQYGKQNMKKFHFFGLVSFCICCD